MLYNQVIRVETPRYYVYIPVLFALNIINRIGNLGHSGFIKKIDLSDNKTEWSFKSGSLAARVRNSTSGDIFIGLVFTLA